MIYAISIIAVLMYGMLILWFVRFDLTERPVRLLSCILMGVGSAAVALLAEYYWNVLLGGFISSHPSLVILESFIGVGVIEEFAKWVWLVWVVYSWKTFDRYADGILYTCGIAAGFNLAEGTLYAMTDSDIMNSVIRCFTAIPVHFLLAIIMGFLFARYKLESKKFFWFSILIPVVLHGLYDFFIFQQYTELLMGGALLVLAGCLSLSVWVCRNALRADRVRAIEKSL